MARDLISRYVWIVDTLSRYERLTREELNALWVKSHLSDGTPLPERTFHHYRRAIEENFHLDICCDSRGRYYIDSDTSRQGRAFTNWMLDSYTVSSALKDTHVPIERVEIEDVPSARQFCHRCLRRYAIVGKLCSPMQDSTAPGQREGLCFALIS